MEKRITIELTETDCNAIAQLFQRACQIDGVPAARLAIPLIDRIGNALQSAIVPAHELVVLPSPNPTVGR